MSVAEISLEDEDISLVETMISFLYFGEYPHTQEQGDGGAEDEDEEVCESNDEEDLEDDGQEDIEYDGNTGTKNGNGGDTDEASQLLVHARMYVMANKYGIPALRELAKRAYEEEIDQWRNSRLFLESVPIIFDKIDEADEEVRDLVVSRCSTQLKDFMEDLELRTLVKNLFHNLPALSWEIFERNFDESRVEGEKQAVMATPSSSDVPDDHATEVVHDVEECNCEDSLNHLQSCEGKPLSCRV